MVESLRSKGLATTACAAGAELFNWVVLLQEVNRLAAAASDNSKDLTDLCCF